MENPHWADTEAGSKSVAIWGLEIGGDAKVCLQMPITFISPGGALLIFRICGDALFLKQIEYSGKM